MVLDAVNSHPDGRLFKTGLGPEGGGDVEGPGHVGETVSRKGVTRPVACSYRLQRCTKPRLKRDRGLVTRVPYTGRAGTRHLWKSEKHSRRRRGTDKGTERSLSSSSHTFGAFVVGLTCLAAASFRESFSFRLCLDGCALVAARSSAV
jgi:hypothetical protein